jgi:hypothetical protein
MCVFASAGCGFGDSASRAQGEQPAAAASDSAVAASEPAALVPHVTIVEPVDGAELDGPNVRIVLSIENIELAPVSEQRAGTGHHHLFVNVPPVEPGQAIPAGQTGIVHLGQAQTEHELTNLAPGEYTVISVVGDLVHRRIDPQVLDTTRFRVRAR